MMPPSLDTRFSPLTRIARRRLLPNPGQVLVRAGDWVQPEDTIAVASQPGQLLVLDVAQLLGCSLPAAERSICVAPGQSVQPGEALARRVGRWRRPDSVLAPQAGTIQACTGGQVFLRQADSIQRLLAYIPGVVTEVFPRLGATIETPGALVRGIWGSGEQTSGVLVTMVAHASDELTWDHIGLRYRGTVAVGGRLGDPKVLYRARQFKLQGLVVGSMEPELRGLCQASPLTIVVTEGFGKLAMAEPVFNLLRACHGRPAVLSAQGEGPEVVVPLSGPLAADGDTWRPLVVGTRVRMTRAPHLGLLGEVVATADGRQETPIGTLAEGVHVRLTDGRRLFVPLANLEPLE